MDQSDPSRVFSNVRCITFLAPLLALIPFVHSYAGYPDDRVASNLFMGFLTTVIAMFSIYPISYDIAKVRHSTNMLTAFLYMIVVNTLYSMLLRHISGLIIFPFEAVAIGIVGVPINNSLLRSKIVDLSFEFQWINDGCSSNYSNNNATTSKTWIRGYEWECTAVP